MRALQCTELGGPDKLEINEVESPSAIPGHVVIDVKSGSINFPDVLMIQGLYQYQLILIQSLNHQNIRKVYTA